MNRKQPTQPLQMHFDNAANTYDTSAVLAREVNHRLLERLDFMQLEPKLIIDLGAGTGEITTRLEKKYRKSRLLAIDLSLNMLKKAKQKSPWLSRQLFSCAEAMALPLPDQSVDLVYSNLLFYHCRDYQALFNELNRILRPGGLLLFSTLGPDTYRELSLALGATQIPQERSPFIDMHDLGDAMLRAKFSDPVVDMEKITLDYSKLNTLVTDLYNLGDAYILSLDKDSANPELIATLTSQYPKQTTDKIDHFPVTYEVIYGHAWVPIDSPDSKNNSYTETSIPVSRITNISKEKIQSHSQIHN